MLTSLYRWVFPLFVKGYKKQLEFDDLYRCPSADEAHKLAVQLER